MEVEQRAFVVVGALDAAAGAIWIRRVDGPIVFWNKGAEALFGWSADEVVGRAGTSFLSEPDIRVAETTLHRLLEHGVLRTQTVLHRKDGEVVPVGLDLSVVDPDGTGPYVVVLASDISEQLAQQQQLAQAQRLDAIGQLTGGVAHDFNNVLTVIRSAAELVAERVQDDPASAKLLTSVISAADRGADLAARLLAVARPRDPDPVDVDVTEVVERVVALIRPTLGRRVEVTLDLPDGRPHVRIDAGQLEVALINLCVNADHATPDGGHIALRCIEHASVVRLEVEDTGVGMAPDVAVRAFEPFFTTKAPGRGTGLGLAMVHGFVTDAGGSVHIATTLGSGTTVTIELPASTPVA